MNNYDMDKKPSEQHLVEYAKRFMELKKQKEEAKKQEEKK